MCLAIPGRITTITGEDLLRNATVDFDGVQREVNLAAVPEAELGDWVLVHVGMAINRIDEEEARLVLADLEALREAGENLGPPA